MYTTLLGTEDLRRIVQRVGLDEVMDKIIAGLESTLSVFDNNDTFIPARSGCEYQHPHPGLIEWMPAVQYGHHATIKIVGYHPSNPATHGLPTILSTVSIYDTASGHLLGIMDGTLLTAMRTGAASAIATRVLANPDSRTLGLIGCGAQAVTQLHAITRLFDIQEVLLYDVHPEVCRSFSSRVSFLDDRGIDYTPTTCKDLVGAADIICTGTSVPVGRGPVFEDDGVQPWLHINAIGSDFPGKTEVPRSLLNRSVVCPDFRDQAVTEGECQQLDPDQIGPDLVELVKNKQKYTPLQDKLSVFDSTGWALEDHVAGEIFLGYARRLGVGRQVEIECISDDPKNPYGFVGSPRTYKAPRPVFTVDPGGKTVTALRGTHS